MYQKALLAAFCASALLCLATQASADTQIFFDDFDGSSLDLSKWIVLDGAGGMQVSGSLFRTQGGPDHKRINTTATFSPTQGSLVASARIRLASSNPDSYQKFGFNVNGPFESPNDGFYFDTLEPPAGGETGFIHALVVTQPPAGPPVILLDQKVPVTWFEFHDFAVEWTPTEITFSIDNLQVAQLNHSFVDPLPVGVWNDRPGLMETDWVKVIRTATAVNIDIKPGSDPNCFNIDGHGVIPVAILGSADFDVANVDDTSLMLDGFAVRVRGNKGPLCSVEFSNADLFPDLVCHFEDGGPENWTAGAATATLTGNLKDEFGGLAIEGTDSICIVP
jgi:hypothetical protein